MDHSWCSTPTHPGKCVLLVAHRPRKYVLLVAPQTPDFAIFQTTSDPGCQIDFDSPTPPGFVFSLDQNLIYSIGQTDLGFYLERLVAWVYWKFTNQ